MTLNPIKVHKKGFSTETKRLSKLEQISLKQRAVPAVLPRQSTRQERQAPCVWNESAAQCPCPSG